MGHEQPQIFVFAGANSLKTPEGDCTHKAMHDDLLLKGGVVKQVEAWITVAYWETTGLKGGSPDSATT
jgi:hypothetical protein